MLSKEARNMLDVIKHNVAVRNKEMNKQAGMPGGLKALLAALGIGGAAFGASKLLDKKNPKEERRDWANDFWGQQDQATRTPDEDLNAVLAASSGGSRLKNTASPFNAHDALLHAQTLGMPGEVGKSKDQSGEEKPADIMAILRSVLGG